MKKISLILLIYFFGFILACCPDNRTQIIYNTIKDEKVILFSFDENGKFPYIEHFNPAELGIGVLFNTLTSRTEIVHQTFSTMPQAYACEYLPDEIFTNRIDSINVFTVFYFDDDHPAGSNVNDILLVLDSVGDTKRFEIKRQSEISHHFKFSVIPQNDSIQFEITGRITDKGEFTDTTELVVL